MVASDSHANQRHVGGRLLPSVGGAVIAVMDAFLLWLGLTAWPPTASPRLLLLLAVITQQSVFLVVSIRFESMLEPRTLAQAISAGVLVMLVAVVLGIGYDGVVRWLFGAESPSMGPWGEVRRLEFLPATALVAWGVLLGPAGDEWVFRAGLFGAWRDAGRPWTGALFSSALVALQRLEPLDVAAFFGLGLLLCAVYRWTGSLLAVWLGHALLNAAMFVLLFCGYE